MRRQPLDEQVAQIIDPLLRMVNATPLAYCMPFAAMNGIKLVLYLHFGIWWGQALLKLT